MSNLLKDNKELMKEYDFEKNINININKLKCGSEKKIWWRCNNGHEWQAMIYNRNKGNGCPYCSGRLVIKGENDLETSNPKLASEWNYEKNGTLKPEQFLINSNKKVWWKCKKGHEWQTAIVHRKNGTGCPYCSGRYAIKGGNDLQTINPTLAKEWNYEKNNSLTPMDVKPNSNKTAWWKCKKGHEWQAKINNRNNGTGCPICNSERNTSMPEFAIMFYLKKYNLEAMHSYKEYGYELDVYIPSMKIAIEYDGYYWHKNKAEKDLEKNQKCKKDGVKLYRIREGLPSLNDSSIDYIINKDKEDLSKAIEKILSDIIRKNVVIDLKRDIIDIENLREYKEKENSILFYNSLLAKEWNYGKNGSLKPEHFLINSNKKVWWICSKGHEWQAKISDRNKGNGCPYCSSNIILRGYNDLQSINPVLAKEWNYEKNNGLTPTDVQPNSNKKFWWICGKGHEWQASAINRNKGRGCPYCSNKKVLKGYNDLGTINPTLASEWNYKKNNRLTPEDVLSNSSQKVWWRCNNGHEWQSIIHSRNSGVGCPYCSSKKVLKGYNDLETINPVLAKEWNYEKNINLKPTMVTVNSGKEVWWKCSEGHEWVMRIQTRNRGAQCPMCKLKK